MAKSQMRIGNLLLLDIPVLAEKTVSPKNRLRMEESFEVEVLTRNHWREDGG